uniref:GRAM domain-containing protein n=1 Tax=Myripristis murdjan TaxID=586833 RepID=A0A667X8X6_9TELE
NPPSPGIRIIQIFWINSPQAPPTTYKQRFEEFKRLFKEIPESERLIMDYPCALQRDILLQGRLYLSENWLCFYSNVFWGTKIILNLKYITTMSREKTARLIPNAIQISTSTEKVSQSTLSLFFTSFSAREKSYLGVFRLWQNTLMDKVRPGSAHLPPDTCRHTSIPSYQFDMQTVGTMSHSGAVTVPHSYLSHMHEEQP